MICTQCGALLMEDRFMDWAARWRCLECGHLADTANVESFLLHHKQERRPTDESDYWGEEVHLGPESYISSLLLFHANRVVLRGYPDHSD
jgi:hypothetical protein